MTEVRELKVLDHGHVRLIDFMGNDRRIVDAARVSYQVGTKAVSSDRHLIRYLIRNYHTTPLEKIRFEFHVKLPLFVARQWMRHRTGTFNEVSARYSVLPDQFYIPQQVRKQSASNRQGSSDQIVDEVKIGDPLEPILIDPQTFLEETSENAYAHYQALLEAGTARELARTVLPVNIYTEFYWTVDLWNLMHFLRLRLDPHAQYEIRVYAEAILSLIKDNCDLDYAIEAFEDYVLDAPRITRYELNILKDLLISINGTNFFGEQNLSDIIREDLSTNPHMSEREKKESRLIELLELEDED